MEVRRSARSFDCKGHTLRCGMAVLDLGLGQAASAEPS